MDSSPPFTTAIVGCGGISRAHGDAIEGNDDRIDFVACCDVDPDAADAFADRYGVPRTYTKLEELLASEELDVVILATWPNLHEAQVLTCVEAGVPAVLCEKSLSTNAESGARMVRAAAEGETLLVEAFMYRHHPRTLELVERLESGEIGDLRHVRAGFHMKVEDESNWRRDPDRAGGVAYDLTSYPVNFVGGLFGEPPERVAAEWIRREDGLVESLYATLRYPEGTVAIIESSQTAAYRLPLEVRGIEGALSIEHAWLPDDVIERISGNWQEDFERERIETQNADPYEEQILHVCECLERGAEPRFTAAESVRNAAVMDALLESAETGRFVAPTVPEGF